MEWSKNSIINRFEPYECDECVNIHLKGWKENIGFERIIDDIKSNKNWFINDFEDVK